MGCCQSTPQDDNESPTSSPSNVRDDPSSRAHATAPPQLSNSLHTSASPRHERRSPQNNTHRRRLALGEQFNAPLQPHVWTSKRRQWTKAELDRERSEFFETRVTGHAEIWATLRIVVGLMADGDLATAQSIIDAAAITVPTGDLKNGVYDEAGNLYQMPEHIISDPQNVVLSSLKGVEADSEAEGADQEELDQKREEKGKTVLKLEDTIKVKARLSDRGGPDIIVAIGKEQAVRILIRRIKEEANISTNVKVKIAYLGKIMQDSESLQAQGWHEGHVVNGLVFQ